jgi:hypothetical protein
VTNEAHSYVTINQRPVDPVDERLIRMVSGAPAGDLVQTPAWFVGVTVAFTDLPDVTADLDRIVAAWIDHSGLNPPLAQVDVRDAAITFWKGFEVPPGEAVPLAITAVDAACEHALSTGQPRRRMVIDINPDTEVGDLNDKR